MSLPETTTILSTARQSMMSLSLLFWTLSISLLGCAYLAIQLLYRPRAKNHPPFAGPGCRENIAQMTNIKTNSAVTHIHDLSLSVRGFGKTAYGAVFQIYMLTSNYVFVTDFNLARLILAGDASRGIKESEKTMFGRNRGGGLFPNVGSLFSCLTADKERRKTRKFLAPCFSMTKLQYTFQVMLDSLTYCAKKLDAYSNENKTADLNDVMIRLTFDVITSSSFGVNWNTQVEGSKSDGTMYLEECDLRMREGYRRAFNPFLKYCFWSKDCRRFDVTTERILAILNKVVSDYRASHPTKESMEEDQSIMGHLMRHEYESEERRVTDMNTFLGAGHETTSHTLTMMMICLCKNPKARRKLQEELDKEIPSDAKHHAEHFPSVSTILSLPYLSGCIQEAIRLYPVTGTGSKRTTVSDIEYEGVLIPKGSTCTIAYYSMYRQPWIENADDFIPERWDSSSEQAQELKDLLMPFGVGTRNCIGQNLAKVELAMVSSYLMRFFEFELVSEPSYHVFVTMKASNVFVKVHARN